MASVRPVRIHLPWTAAIVPLLLFLCVTPLATAGRGWLAMYLLPALALLAVVAGGTTATTSHLSARWLRGRTRIAWDEVHQLEFPGQRWAVVVTQSGARVVLPGVRPVDLPRIVAAAGSRLFLQRPVTAATDDRADDPAGTAAGADPADDTADGPVDDTAHDRAGNTDNVVDNSAEDTREAPGRVSADPAAGEPVQAPRAG